MELLITGCVILFAILLIGYLFTHLRLVLVWSVIICAGICAIVYNAIFWFALSAVALIVWGYAIHYIRLFINGKYKRKNTIR